MKKRLCIVGLLAFSMTALWSQENTSIRIPLIGEDAPSFTAQSTNGTITFPDDYGRNWKIIFSHPKDFTPVCSSEILELAQMQNEFDKLDTKLVVVSADALSEHYSWRSALDTLKYKDRAPVTINFAFIDDSNYNISRKYGMLHMPTSTERDIRGVFIIDPQNKIRAEFFYPMEIGRNLDEIERTLIALQTHDKQNVLTPADWKPGDDVFLPFEDHQSKTDPNVYRVSWFMLAKKMNTNQSGSE
jgi:peroxiredoxin (alkyl hydroperoxide reductase subunit C)